MMKKAKIILLLIAGFLMVFAAILCHTYVLNDGYVPSPDAMKLYYQGETRQLVSDKGTYDFQGDESFYDICKMVTFKMPDEVGIDNSSVLAEGSSEIMVAKEDAIGFVYNKSKKIIIKNGKPEQVRYNEILFVLNGIYKDNVYIRTTDNKYIFVGVRNNPEYINKNLFY